MSLCIGSLLNTDLFGGRVCDITAELFCQEVHRLQM